MNIHWNRTFLALSIACMSLAGCAEDESSTVPTESGETAEEGGETAEDGGETAEEGGETAEEGGETAEEGGEAAEEGGEAAEEGGEAAEEGGEAAEEGGEASGDLDIYSFDSKLNEGESSTSYTGQIARQLLISELKASIGSLTALVDDQTLTNPDETYIIDNYLAFYFDFDADSYGDEPFMLTTDPGTLQKSINEISSGKNLIGKIAGNDPTGDSKGWDTFQGWPGVDSPEALVNTFFSMIAANTAARINGDVPEWGVHVSAEGHDLQQLTQKFLFCAINFSQVADDYMDEGLGKDNLEPYAEGKAYTALEHAWDEAFGYFGAARAYLSYSDEEIASNGGQENWQGYHDWNEDGSIDLAKEYNWGASVNAAKRDLGSTTGTDFTNDIFSAFHAGRALIGSLDGELTAEQMEELEMYRDAAVDGYEKAYAATVVHYINDVLGDMTKMDTPDYKFTDLAKHWSELKGFAMCFQFNPKGPLGGENIGLFVELHDLIGRAPVLGSDTPENIEAYKVDLLAARDLLRDAYTFASEDVENW